MTEASDNKMEEYHAFMKRTFPQTLPGQWNQCVKFVEIMHRQFPELRVVKGYVSSPDNADNNSLSDYDKQYTHVWLETKGGDVIDPTVLQYELLGKLNYQEFEGKFTGWCPNCGKIIYDHATACSERCQKALD